MSTRIYLAVPYSNPDPDVRSERFNCASDWANRLTRQGKIIYSPITHGHVLSLWGGLPVDFDFWQTHCLSFLRSWAQELYVLTIPGWEQSKGVQAEMEEAQRLKLPITRIM